MAVSPSLPPSRFGRVGPPLLLLHARDSAVRRRNDGVSALRCRMCISVMCVEVGRAAGLIRSSQLFPPSLSSRSLEYCAVRSDCRTTPSLRRLQLQKLPSSLRRTLNAVRTRRYSNALLCVSHLVSLRSHRMRALFPYQITQVCIHERHAAQSIRQVAHSANRRRCLPPFRECRRARPLSCHPSLDGIKI